MRRLSTIIVDANAGSRDHLRELCKSRTDLDLIAECGGYEEARQVILTRQPDLAFLAARLNGATGFQLARELPESATPLLVFVSTHDQYALQAFELGAVDYILHPVSRTRFCEAVQRAVSRARVCEPRANDSGRAAARDGSVVKIVDRVPRVNGFHRFIIEIGDRVHLVDINEVESI